jgi:hypothetical protein
MHTLSQPYSEILSMKTRSSFMVDGKISLDNKLNVFFNLLSISFCNFQGAYIAKTEDSIYASEIPAEGDFRQFSENIKNRINNEWK